MRPRRETRRDEMNATPRVLYSNELGISLVRRGPDNYAVRWDALVKDGLTLDEAGRELVAAIKCAEAYHGRKVD
jgi:hypothetical protein